MTTFEKACAAVKATRLLEYDDSDTLHAIVKAVLTAIHPAPDGPEMQDGIDLGYVVDWLDALLADAPLS